MTLKYRVKELEKKYDDLDVKIDKILTNHLPHLSIDIAEIKTRQTVTTVIQVGAMILALAIQKFMLMGG